MLDLVCSIVTYKEDQDILVKNISAVLGTKLNVKVVVVDNSPDDRLNQLSKDLNVEYIFNGANLGYGKAHNVALKKYDGKAKYNLVLNPDVMVQQDTLQKLFDYMEKNTDVGLVMPDVFYQNGQRQYVCKQIPKPKDLIFRRFLGVSSDKYEMRDMDYSKPFQAPVLSGCFMFIRNSILKEVGLFDERFFMYMEDVDLSRRINEKYKTMFCPCTKITHEYKKGSYNNHRLLFHHIASAVKYFNKWGWVV